MTNEELGRIRAYAYTVARRRGMQHQDAEDAAQEALLTCLRREDAYDASKSEMTLLQFLLFVARGRVAQFNGRKVNGSELVPTDLGATLETDEPNSADKALEAFAYDTTEEAGIASTLVQPVRVALEALPEAERDVITRIYLEDQSSEEVAKARGVDHAAGAVRAARRRGLERLRQNAELAALVG